MSTEVVNLKYKFNRMHLQKLYKSKTIISLNNHHSSNHQTKNRITTIKILMIFLSLAKVNRITLILTISSSTTLMQFLQDKNNNNNLDLKKTKMFLLNLEDLKTPIIHLGNKVILIWQVDLISNKAIRILKILDLTISIKIKMINSFKLIILALRNRSKKIPLIQGLVEKDKIKMIILLILREEDYKKEIHLKINKILIKVKILSRIHLTSKIIINKDLIKITILDSVGKLTHLMQK